MQNTTPISFGDILREIEFQKFGEDEEMFYEKCVSEARRFVIKSIASAFWRGEDSVNMSFGFTAEDEAKLGYLRLLEAAQVVRDELRKMKFDACIMELSPNIMYLRVSNVGQLRSMTVGQLRQPLEASFI